MAGRIQLTTRGVQDIYFTDNPDYSYFVQLFRKHTNYTTQFVKLDMDNSAEFGKTVSITIPKDQGDLLKSVSLEIELDKIAGSDVTRIGYIESIGHGIIEYVDMYIGDQKVQHIPSDYLQIYSEQNYTQSKQKALEKLIGKYPDRTSDVPVSSGVILGHLGPATTTRKLFVDIPFYFYRKPELSIPLCSMCFQEIRFEIKFRELKDCLVKTDPQVDTSLETTTLDFDLISSEQMQSTNVIGVSRDGNTIAYIVGGNIEITARGREMPFGSTFTGTGVVSPGMNIIVTPGNIYRYQNSQWVGYTAPSISTSNTIQFSDDGNVILEVGVGLFIWDGSNYTHTSNPSIVALSGDGNFYCLEGSGLKIEIFNTSTGTRLGGFFNKAANSPISQAHLSHDGTKLLVVLNNNITYIYSYTTDWFRYGQNITLFESGLITFSKDGNSFFVYNVNEEYDHGSTTKYGVGRVYVYDTTTTQWTEVHRYKGDGGTFASMSDDKLKLHITRSTGTDVINLKELTRSVEGYDEVVVKSVENIVDAGSNVYGAGYQSLVARVQDTIAFNSSTVYSQNTTQFLPIGPLNETIISNNGLIRVDHYTTGNQIRVFSRVSTTVGFQQLFITDAASLNQSKVNLSTTSLTFSKFSISKTGRYFAVQDHVTNQVLIYEVFDNYYRNIQYVEEGTPNVLATTQFAPPTPSILEGLKFSDDETAFTMYGGNDIKTFLISNPTTPSRTILEDTFVSSNIKIVAVSKDVNRFIKHDSSNNLIRIFTINQDGTLVKGLPINLQSSPLAFELSKNGTLAAIVTSTFTYIYSFDGSGWKQKSSLFVGIGTFRKFYMVDDGNTIIYVKSETTPNRTLIELYTYKNNAWIRVHEENDNSTINTLGIGDVSTNGHHIVSLYNENPNFPKRNARVKQIGTQQLSVVVGVDKDISQVYPKQVLSCKLSLEVAFLDKYERAIIKDKKRDYIITQLQHNRFLAPKSIESHKFRTSFLNPVKELYFIVKRVNNEQYLDFVSPFDYDNDKITSENKLIFYENLKSLEFKLNDTQVLDQDTGNFAFLKAIQPAIHHSKTPLIRRFYTYSFCMEPEQHFPTGQVNFSLVNNQLFTFNLTENTTSDRYVDIYALSYNILRLDKGMMRVMFNTT